MLLNPTMARQGQWLFRWRSYLPLALVGLLFFHVWRHPVSFQSLRVETGWELLCAAVTVLGLVIRVVTVGVVPNGTSGRNTKRHVASRLNTTGTYSVVRNPLYVANFLIELGPFLLSTDFLLVTTYVLCFCLFYERIVLSEEDFLRQKFGDAFLNWARATPCFVPRLRAWTAAAPPISLRQVVRREYTTWFVVTVQWWGLLVLKRRTIDGRWDSQLAWIGVLALSVLCYLAVWYLKHNTTLLRARPDVA